MIPPLLVFFTNKRNERGSKSKLVVKNDGYKKGCEQDRSKAEGFISQRSPSPLLVFFTNKPA